MYAAVEQDSFSTFYCKKTVNTTLAKLYEEMKNQQQMFYSKSYQGVRNKR